MRVITGAYILKDPLFAHKRGLHDRKDRQESRQVVTERNYFLIDVHGSSVTPVLDDQKTTYMLMLGSEAESTTE